MKHKIEIAPNLAIYIDGERVIGSKPYGMFLTTTMIVSDDDLKRLVDRCLEVIADCKTEDSSEKSNNCEDEPKYEMGMGTLKCDNCLEYGSFKCTKCDGEMYFKRLGPKTEPTISKMEQVDKDINVRSKDKPQTDCAWK